MIFEHFVFCEASIGTVVYYGLFHILKQNYFFGISHTNQYAVYFYPFSLMDILVYLSTHAEKFSVKIVN